MVIVSREKLRFTSWVADVRFLVCVSSAHIQPAFLERSIMQLKSGSVSIAIVCVLLSEISLGHGLNSVIFIVIYLLLCLCEGCHLDTNDDLRGTATAFPVLVNITYDYRRE